MGAQPFSDAVRPIGSGRREECDLRERSHGNPVIAIDSIGITPILSARRIYYPNYVEQAHCITPFLSTGRIFVSALSRLRSGARAKVMKKTMKGKFI